MDNSIGDQDEQRWKIDGNRWHRMQKKQGWQKTNMATHKKGNAKKAEQEALTLRVKGDRHPGTFFRVAPDFTPGQPKERIHHKGIVALFETLPPFQRDFRVRPPVRFLFFDVGFFQHAVQIFVEPVQQEIHEFTGILLLVPLKIGCSFPDQFFDPRGAAHGRFIGPHALQQVGVTLRQPTAHPQGVVRVDGVFKLPGQEMLRQRFAIGQALQHGIHETRVA